MGIPGKQMIRLGVATVDIQIGALLLDHEYLASQAQQRIEFGRAELRKAAPSVMERLELSRGLRRMRYPKYISKGETECPPGWSPSGQQRA